jgi:large subunit ribosomal protein L30
MANKKQSKQQKSAQTIRVQYYRSSIACPKKHKQTVRSMGLTRLNQIVERPDTPSTRGAVAKLPHLLRIVEQETILHFSLYILDFAFACPRAY